ncbi:MAG: monothiol glutaredoxin, Grx4 family [Gammaproteobacteria bacterium RIFCSPHIGHO2_12_FULL_37_14]|nr:MAG: monothiol glutaredoxin, Grx4 family [Gammaproteobacteria bacterium RIFCSPHIGHO2_12_FULL_37_14]
MNIQDKIKQQIAENDIILYMKGNAELPQCGFSARAVNILKSYGAKFTTVDVLQDEAIRHGIKVYSNWPTIPQLYIKGEFIGGSDIIAEMHEAGELQELIKRIFT